MPRLKKVKVLVVDKNNMLLDSFNTIVNTKLSPDLILSDREIAYQALTQVTNDIRQGKES